MTASVLQYIDAGSGSMILQMLAGGAAAVAVFAKFYWRRLLRFLGIRKSDEPSDPRSPSPDDATPASDPDVR